MFTQNTHHILYYKNRIKSISNQKKYGNCQKNFTCGGFYGIIAYKNGGEQEKMLYSENVNKVCGLCVKAKAVKGSETHMHCEKHNEYVGISREGCESFEYDIFKRPARRRKIKKSSGKFSPEDFML